MWRMLRFGVKAGVTTSAIYFTVDQGIWKDSNTTVQIYDNLCHEISPYVSPYVEKIPFEIPKLPELPRAGNPVTFLQTYWNKGVLATFEFLVDLPDLVSHYGAVGACHTMRFIKQQMESADELPAPAPSETLVKES